ncbi:MAG: hypothetical protein RLZZ488_1903 [Pseudomonadota bacterium]|jgi:hypothetical protein
MKHNLRKANMEKHKLATGVSLATLVLAAACGTLEVRDLKDTFGSKSKGSGTTDQEWATIRIGLTPSQLLTSKLVDSEFDAEQFSLFAFDLVNAASFKFKVSGCASGFTVASTAVTGFSTNVKLYKTDKNCEVGLVEFGYDSKIYTPTAVTELKGPVGTSAMFQASDGSELKVKVFKQLLSTGLQSGEDVAFTYLKATKGADSNVVQYTSGATLNVNGIEAPAFTLSAVNLTDVAAADGKGTFRFTLQCAQNLVQPNGGTDWACPRINGETDPQLITDMHVKLIEDVANESTYTYDEIEGFMSGGTTPVTNAMKVVGNSTNVQVSGQVGPGKLVEKKQMLFIVSYTDPVTGTNPTSRGKSYVYFNVDIGDPEP